MLLMVQKGNWEGLCHAKLWYVKIKESSYPKYWDVNNLYGWPMLQKLPVNTFEFIEDIFQFNEEFIETYNKKIEERYFLKVDFQKNEKLHTLHNDLPYLPEKNENWKSEKLPPNLHDKTEYVIYKGNLN